MPEIVLMILLPIAATRHLRHVLCNQPWTHLDVTAAQRPKRQGLKDASSGFRWSSSLMSGTHKLMITSDSLRLRSERLGLTPSYLRQDQWTPRR